MKSARSLTVIVCLVVPALPASAQDLTETASPLTRALTREAVRLAAAGSPQVMAIGSNYCPTGCPLASLGLVGFPVGGRSLGLSPRSQDRRRSRLRDHLRRSVGGAGGSGLVAGCSCLVARPS